MLTALADGAAREVLVVVTVQVHRQRGPSVLHKSLVYFVHGVLNYSVLLGRVRVSGGGRRNEDNGDSKDDNDDDCEEDNDDNCDGEDDNYDGKDDK